MKSIILPQELMPMSTLKKAARNYEGKERLLFTEEYHRQLNNVDESIIWLNFQDGNEEALIYIYRKYAETIYNYGCQFTHNHQLVWDAVQDLFCDLIKNRKRLGKVSSIKGYLFKSLKRKIIRSIRKERRNECLSDQHDSFLLKLQSGVTSISQGNDDELNQIIEKFINQLPSHQREVLLLYFYEGLSYQEIADMFEVKVKSIRTQTYRALETLSRHFKANKKNFVLIVILLIMKILQ